MNFKQFKNLGIEPTRNGITSAEWISSVALLAAADRTVIYHIAKCILAASSSAGIFAFLAHAGSVLRAFRIDDTLGSASGRAALISRQA